MVHIERVPQAKSNSNVYHLESLENTGEITLWYIWYMWYIVYIKHFPERVIHLQIFFFRKYFIGTHFKMGKHGHVYHDPGGESHGI